MTIEHFKSIKGNITERFTTGIDDLDWIYGGDSNGYGIPYNAMSLWGGSAGVGKTRTVTSVLNSILSKNLKVVYFTLEMSKAHFVSKYCNKLQTNAQLFISEENDLYKQVEICKDLKADLVVVDSLNKISNFQNGRGSNDIEAAYREALKTCNSHILFICQLNSQGKVKGGTDMSHMVDAVFTVNRLSDNSAYEFLSSCIAIECPEKNRYGKTGQFIVGKHESDGVRIFSEHRFNDTDYLKDKNIVIPQVEQQPVKLVKEMNGLTRAILDFLNPNKSF